MKTLIFLFLILNLSFSANAGSTWLRERTFHVYDYIYEGEIIKQFEVPNRSGPSNKPLFYAKCAINIVNGESDEEGRYSFSERVDIYCGKNPVISLSGLTENGLNKTNLFGDTILEAKDKNWVVFLPNNDSDVPGYAHLQSNGTLTLMDLRDYAIFSDFIGVDNKNINNEKATINVLAKNLEEPSSNGRVKSKLTIYRDGKYKITYENN